MVIWKELQQELQTHQHENGLFPAAIESENKLMKEFFWIRDNYYCYLAVNNNSKQKITTAFQKIFDKIEAKGKFNFEDFNPDNEYTYIHPLYTKDLNEKTDGWAYLQNDAVGNMLEIFSNAKDEKRATTLVEYLKTIEYFNCQDYGFWEEPPKKLRSSSLTACIRGLESFMENIGSSSEIKRLTGQGYVSLDQAPNETETRKSDLALLSLIYPKKIIEPKIEQQIITNIRTDLVGEHGIKRYLGDKWNGIGWTLGENKEMQWVIGLPWLYLCTKDKQDLITARKTIKKFGYAEGIINNQPNCTKLTWTLAMHVLAEKQAYELGH